MDTKLIIARTANKQAKKSGRKYVSEVLNYSLYSYRRKKDCGIYPRLSLPAEPLAVMLRQTIYILTILLLTCCNNTDRRFTQDFIVFESDTRDKDIGFKPTASQIGEAEQKLLDYLETKTKTNQTIFVNSLDGKVPLQDQLKFYKRRYFGRTSIEGEQIIKIEFVFVRCGGQDEWKKVDYTNDNTKDCWWSVQYSVDHDQIYDLKL